MTSRLVRKEMRFGAQAKRERSVATHVPYARHVDDTVLRTKDGLLLSTLKLDGFCFETADMAQINGKLEGRNTILRSLGSSRYAVYGHMIRRRLEPKLEGEFDSEFAAELNRRYMAQLEERRMFVNDMYITVVRRPLRGQVGLIDSFTRSLFAGRGVKDQAKGARQGEDEELRELHDAVLGVREVLLDYQARILGIREPEPGNYFSEPLEFLVQILNGLDPVSMRLPRMPLDGALAMKRLHFGRNAVEFVGATPPRDSRLGAMLSVREYPSYTGPLLLDGLLKVPHEFIVSQSFSIVDKPVAQNQMERVYRQISMADEAGSIVGNQLAGARDELLSSRSIYGEHHLSVMCLGDDKAELDRCIRSVGATLTDQSIIWLREDLNCEAAFWAQLPGNFSYIARSAMISSKNFAGFLSLHNFPSGQKEGNHWGSAISLLETTSQSAYFFNFHVRDLGNFTMVGPSGSGKTVALSFLMAQSQRIKPTPRCIFLTRIAAAKFSFGHWEATTKCCNRVRRLVSIPSLCPTQREIASFCFSCFRRCCAVQMVCRCLPARKASFAPLLARSCRPGWIAGLCRPLRPCCVAGFALAMTIFWRGSKNGSALINWAGCSTIRKIVSLGRRFQAST